jgi:ribose/xylose/arabinose/galactoside ABC-type transport system permease subunit
VRTIVLLLKERTYTLLLLIVLICIGASIAFPGQFPTFQNLQQVLLNISIETIVAVAMMVLMISGMFDLSVGSVAALAGGLTAWLIMHAGFPVALAVLCAIAASLLSGLFNGYFISRIGINPLIQTLASMGMLRGLALLVAGAGIQNLPYSFIYIGQSKMLGLQSPIWWMIIVVIVFHYLTRYTTFFRRYYYIGSNEKAATLSGIHVKNMKLYGFVLSALLAGIAGILLTSRLGAAISSIGKGMELRVITAVILGGASLQGGQGKILGALLGTVFIGLVSNVMVLSRVSGSWQEIIIGVLLIAAIWFDVVIQRKAENI